MLGNSVLTPRFEQLGVGSRAGGGEGRAKKLSASSVQAEGN